MATAQEDEKAEDSFIFSDVLGFYASPPQDAAEIKPRMCQKVLSK